MTKQTLEYASDERMKEIDAAEEFMHDLRAGTQAFDDEYAKRIEWLKKGLYELCGKVTQWYPRWEDWEDEHVEDLRNLIAWAWHFRQEIRLLTVLARAEHDATDRVAEWAFYSDKEFGPLPAKVALLN